MVSLPLRKLEHERRLRFHHLTFIGMYVLVIASTSQPVATALAASTTIAAVNA